MRTQGLGRRQRAVLAALARVAGNDWRPELCGWVYGSRSETAEILDSLVRRRLVRKDGDRYVLAPPLLARDPKATVTTKYPDTLAGARQLLADAGLAVPSDATSTHTTMTRTSTSARLAAGASTLVPGGRNDTARRRRRGAHR